MSATKTHGGCCGGMPGRRFLVRWLFRTKNRERLELDSLVADVIADHRLDIPVRDESQLERALGGETGGPGLDDGLDARIRFPLDARGDLVAGDLAQRL